MQFFFSFLMSKTESGFEHLIHFGLVEQPQKHISIPSVGFTTFLQYPHKVDFLLIMLSNFKHTLESEHMAQIFFSFFNFIKWKRFQTFITFWTI